MRVTVEVRKFNEENKIFFNNELFDWGIDEENINQIKQIKNDEELQGVKNSIKEYFINSLEEFLGKKITIKELLDSLKEGYIDL